MKIKSLLCAITLITMASFLSARSRRENPRKVPRNIQLTREHAIILRLRAQATRSRIELALGIELPVTTTHNTNQRPPQQTQSRIVPGGLTNPSVRRELFPRQEGPTNS